MYTQIPITIGTQVPITDAYICVCVRVHVCVCVWLFVCVCVWQRDRERDMGAERKRYKQENVDINVNSSGFEYRIYLIQTQNLL